MHSRHDSRIQAFVWLLLLMAAIPAGLRQIPAAQYTPAAGTGPAGDTAAAPDIKTIANLTAFARLYGYIRYFYPGDEAARLDWDRFAILGVRQVEDARNPEELKICLEKLFLPVAPALRITAAEDRSPYPLARITPPDTTGLQLVAWQHLGLGTGSHSVYRSSRLNRPRQEGGQEQFVNLIRYIDAGTMQGKNIKLVAAVRADGAEGHLWLRVDRPGRQTGFFDNMDNRPVTGPAWKDYEITGPVAADALQIYFGCFIQGDGRVSVDNFRLLVQEEGGWQTIPLPNGDFEESKPENKLVSWMGVPKPDNFVLSQDSPPEGKQYLVLQKNSGKQVMASLFESRPAIGDCVHKEIGSGLVCQFPLVLYGTPEATWPAAPQAELEQLIRDMPPVPDPATGGDNRYVRLADVAICWNVLQHFYPYFDVVPVDWPAQLPLFLEAAWKDRNHLDFLKTLRRLTAGIQDGHVWVSHVQAEKEMLCAPLQWEWVAGKLLITALLDPGVTGIRVGDEVLTIGGRPAAQVFAAIEQEISAATPGYRRFRAGTGTLIRDKEQPFKLAISSPAGEKSTVEIPCTLTLAEYFARQQAGKTGYRPLGEGLYYLNLTCLTTEELSPLLPELAKARGIVCDLRGYPRIGPELIQHLLKQPESTAWMHVPQIIRPDHDPANTFQSFGWNLRPATPHLEAKVVFLADSSVISYGESFLGYIKDLHLATIIGQPTAGTNGNVNSSTLPGGYRFSFTGMKVTGHSGVRLHGAGIIPDLLLEKTVEGVRAGRDEWLEKAIELLR